MAAEIKKAACVLKDGIFSNDDKGNASFWFFLCSWLPSCYVALNYNPYKQFYFMCARKQIDWLRGTQESRRASDLFGKREYRALDNVARRMINKGYFASFGAGLCGTAARVRGAR